MPAFQTHESWTELAEHSSLFKHLCEEVLPEYLFQCRWFGGKAGHILQVSIEDVVHLQDDFRHYYLLVVEVFFKESFAHHYLLPLALKPAKEPVPEHALLVNLQLPNGHFQLIDAVYDQGFHRALYHQFHSNNQVKTGANCLYFKAQEPLLPQEEFHSQLLNAEQSNSTLILQEAYFLKLFRRLFRDKNPDFEINEFLAQQSIFKNYPTLAGLIWLRTSSGFEISLGLMQKKVPNQGDAWNWMLGELKSYFTTAGHEATQDFNPEDSFIKPLKFEALPAGLQQNPGQRFFKQIQKLAQRTAEMHLALAAERRDRNFNPIAYNSDFTVWLKNRLIYQFEARYNLLAKKKASLPQQAQAMADEVIAQKDFIINFILGFDEETLQSSRIRIHGDYHLGQILIQNDDFYILDFEGEPESTIRDRKVKQSPLKDVAGLFRSFHYALFATLFNEQEDYPNTQQLSEAKALYRSMVGVFMRQYRQIAFNHNLDIGYHKEINYLLHYFLLEKAIYELGYELNGRPGWAIIPLRGIIEIIKEIKEHEQA